MTPDLGADEAEAAAEAEFDVVAAWTADAVAELGADHSVPAGCRGSGSPAALDWLGEALALRRGARLVDSGAGTGGPAAYAAHRFGVQPVMAEPMAGACRAARRMFAYPVVAAEGGRLPLASGTVPAAWCLGVLSTTVDELTVLDELHRVLAPDGDLGLLVLVRTIERLPEKPADNAFLAEAELTEALEGAGFAVIARRNASDLPDPPAQWSRRADEVREVMARDHVDDPRWLQACEDEEIIGRLLGAGHVVARLFHARHS